MNSFDFFMSGAFDYYLLTAEDYLDFIQECKRRGLEFFLSPSMDSYHCGHIRSGGSVKAILFPSCRMVAFLIQDDKTVFHGAVYTRAKDDSFYWR